MLDLFRRQNLEIKYFKIQERGPWMLRCSIWMFWDLWVCGCVCGCVGVWVCGCVGVWVCVWWWVCGCGGGVCVCVCVVCVIHSKTRRISVQHISIFSKSERLKYVYINSHVFRYICYNASYQSGTCVWQLEC